MRSLIALALAATLAGCGVARRAPRLVTPTALVAEAPELEGLVEVDYIDRFGVSRAFTMKPFRDTELSRPMQVDDMGAIEVRPTSEEVRMRLFVRQVGLVPNDFKEVQSVTGALPRSGVDEVRWMPGPAPLSEPVVVTIADLSNPYNGYRLRHNDVVLVELSEGRRVERLVFQKRNTGLDLGGTTDVLVRSPLFGRTEGVSLSPALMGGVTVGYRPRRKERVGILVLDELDLVFSGGVGLTSLEAAVSGGSLEEQVDRAVVAALFGSGVKVFDFVSAQVVVNVGELTGGRKLQPTLGIGLDLENLARLIGASIDKVMAPHELSKREPDRAR